MYSGGTTLFFQKLGRHVPSVPVLPVTLNWLAGIVKTA